jgi:hypothetical protein
MSKQEILEMMLNHPVQNPNIKVTVKGKAK